MKKWTVSDFIYHLGEVIFCCFAVSFVLFVVGLFVYSVIMTTIFG